MYFGLDFSSDFSVKDGYVGRYRVEGWEGKDTARLCISSSAIEIADGVVCELQVASPNLSRTFRLDGCIWRVLLANLAPGKTFEGLSQFDREVTQKYSDFLAPIDWFYTGSYRVVPPSEFTTGEIDLVVAASSEEAKERDANTPTPPDMLEMYKTCSSFYTSPKRTLWLLPIELASPGAEFKFPV